MTTRSRRMCLHRLSRHDLETICLKCLEKEPARRYQSAQGTRAELGAFCAMNRSWRGPSPVLRRLALVLAQHALASVLCRLGVGPRARLRRHALGVAQGGGATPARKPYNANFSRKTFYDRDVLLAQRAWDDGDLGVTLSLLEPHLPRAGEKDRRGFEWFYFWNLCQGDQRMTLTNHTQQVNCVAFSPMASAWPLARSEAQCRSGTAPRETG